MQSYPSRGPQPTLPGMLNWSLVKHREHCLAPVCTWIIQCRIDLAVQDIGLCSRLNHCRDNSLGRIQQRSEEHTSELQSRFDLVCRLLLEKKKRRTASSTASSPTITGPAPASISPTRRRLSARMIRSPRSASPTTKSHNRSDVIEIVSTSV